MVPKDLDTFGPDESLNHEAINRVYRRLRDCWYAADARDNCREGVQAARELLAAIEADLIAVRDLIRGQPREAQGPRAGVPPGPILDGR